MLGQLVKPEIEELLQKKDYPALQNALREIHPADIAEIIDDLPKETSGVIFRVLPRELATSVFAYLPLGGQTEVVTALGTEPLVNILNGLAPDDRTRLFEELPAEVTKRVLNTLHPEELKVARQLLGYPEGSAGRTMTPEYLALSPEMTVQEALAYVRSHGKDRETLNVLYVVDAEGRLLDDIRLQTLVLAEPGANIASLWDSHLVSIPATMGRADMVATFAKYDRTVLPVTDSEGLLVGIITADDVLDAAKQGATDDIQGLGGLEALDAPYFDVGFFAMVKKRGGWLSALFLGEMLTATAMNSYQDELNRFVVLALFLPLIISSGGNSGSQATSIIIRSLALREVRLRDWWRVISRELGSGLALGLLLGCIGYLRISIWGKFFHQYGAQYSRVALAVALSLVGVVLYGNVVGSMLPFLLRRVGFDPAKASAPLVATLVDVSGLVIYFSVGGVILGRHLA